MTKYPLTPQEFEQIFSRVPRFCVDLIIRTPNGVVLLLRKFGGWEGMWHFPGSMVHFQESIDEAIKRTAIEEAGITVKVVKFLGHLEFYDEQEKRGFGYTISAAFLCDLTGGELQHDENSSEIKAFKEIPEELLSQHKQFLTEHWDEIKTAW